MKPPNFVPMGYSEATVLLGGIVHVPILIALFWLIDKRIGRSSYAATQAIEAAAAAKAKAIAEEKAKSIAEEKAAQKAKADAAAKAAQQKAEREAEELD